MGVFENGQSNVTLFAFDGDSCIYNTGNNVVINGNMGSGYLSGNNYIENFGAGVSIILGVGADTVANGGSGVGINVGDGRNSVGNAGNSVVITGGSNEDTVVNQGSGVTINSGAGNDSVLNQSSNVLINSTDGKNAIQNYGSSVTINGGAGSDNVFNGSSLVTVNLGAGDDVHVNYYVVQVDSNFNAVATLYSADNVTVNGDGGGDQIENYGGAGTINGGAGGDVIYNYGIFVVDSNGKFIGTSPTDRGYFLDGGDANDYLYNQNSRATISGGAHNDTIISEGNYNSLVGGAGSDSIINYGSLVTIVGGLDSDTIILDSTAANNLIQYNAGDGNDLIQGFNATSTLQIGGGTGTYSSQKSGDDVLVITGAGGDGRITLQGAANLTSVNITGIYFDPLIIIGSEGDDNVAHWGQGVSIDAGTGNDYIFFNGNNISVNGGEGSDTIQGDGSHATIDGGAGDDEIYHAGSEAIITGGKGKDLISLNSAAVNNLIKYASQDDNDLVYGFNETDTLQIINGKIDSVFSNGFDDFIIVDGQAIKLVSASWIRKLNVVDAYGNAIDPGAIAINGTDENDSIVATASGKVILPGAGNDYIFNLGSYMTIAGGTGNKTVELEGNNNVVNLGNGIHIVSLGGSGSTVNTDGAGDTTVLHGYAGVWNIDETGIDGKTLQDKVRQEADENYKKAMDTIDKDPVLDDIAKNGTESPYFVDVPSEEAKAMTEKVRSLKDSGKILDNLEKNGSAQDYHNFLTQQGEFLIRAGNGIREHLNDVDNFNTWITKAGKVSPTGTMGGFILDYINYVVTLHSWEKGWVSYYEKYADSCNRSWSDIGSDHYKNIVDPKKLLDKTLQVDHLLRSKNRDEYDRNAMKGIDVLYGTMAVLGSIALTTVAVAAILEGAAIAVPIALTGLAISAVVGVGSALSKTNYLMNVRPNERTYTDVFASQLFGYGLGGTFENASYRDVPKIIYETKTHAMTVPSVNYDVPLLKNAVKLKFNAAAKDSAVNIALLQGGAGNDSFSNKIELTSISAGAGLDTIMNSAANVTIETGADDDLVRNTGASVKIVGESENNTIENNGENVTIETGAGSDVVKNSEVERVTIATGGGSDYVENFGSSVSVVAGAGDDYILSFGEFNSLDAGIGNDTIHSFGNEATVNAGDGNNMVENLGDNVILKVGSGDNTIRNGGYFVKIETGAGNDVIENIEGKNITIATGGGSDYIENLGDSNSVAAGAGEDYIFIAGNANTVNAGTGSDIIDMEGTGGTEIEWTRGDGFDSIWGFNESSTLKISGGTGTYSAVISDEDIIITAGDEESILLRGATSLSKLNIAGEKIFDYNRMFSGVSDAATAKNFYVSGNIITVGKDAVKTDGTEVKLLTNGYTLKLGKGMTAPKNSVATYSDGIYKTAGKTAGYILNENSITYSAPTTKTFEFSGVSDAATAKNFYVSGNVITVGKDAVKTDGTPVKLLTNGYTLKLGKGMTAPKNSVATYSDGIYKTAGKTAGYILNENSITYSAPTTKTFEFSGLDDDATAKNFYVSGNIITVGKDAVKTDGTPVKLLTNGYKLKLGKGMADGYTLSDDGKSIAYTLGETDALGDALWGNTDEHYQLLVSENFAADDMLQVLGVDDSQDAFFNSSVKEKEITLAISNGFDTTGGSKFK